MMAVSCTSLPPSHGGYECDFADPIPDSFSCPVCLLPFRDPHLVSCCGAKYCAQCIGRVKAAGQACPLCKQEFNTMLDRSLQRKILELKVFCSRKDECQWIGQLRHLDRHEREECGRGMVECSYQCGVRLPRRLMAEHQREMCPRRPMNSKIEVLLQKMEERHKREMAVLREEFRNSLTEERMDHTKEVEGLKQLVVEQKKAIERQLGTKKVGYADIKIAEGSHIKKEIEDLKMSTENKMAEQKEKERQFMHSKLSIHRWETDDRLTRHKKEVDGQIDSKMAEHWRGTDKQLEIRMVELKKETERHVESKMTEQRIPIELQLEYKMTEQKKASERQFEYKMAEQKKTLERQFESKITEQKKTTERHLESKMAELKKETERQMQSKIAEVKKETERQMQSKMAEVKKETERQMQSKMAEVKKETERQMQSKVAELRKETESKMAEQKKESERRLQSKMAEHIKETERQMQSKVAEHIKETERPVESKNAEQKINRPVKGNIVLRTVDRIIFAGLLL